MLHIQLASSQLAACLQLACANKAPYVAHMSAYSLLRLHKFCVKFVLRLCKFHVKIMLIKIWLILRKDNVNNLKFLLSLQSVNMLQKCDILS